MEIIDTIIVGGGPAGSVAAMYLARFNRSVIVFDDGKSRAHSISKCLNYPTYPEGISGSKILMRLHAQAAIYGVVFIEERVTAISSRDGQFCAVTDQGEWLAKSIILATVVRDILPSIDGIESAIKQGSVHVCTVCHAYESNGKNIAIISDAARGMERGMEEAHFMLRYAASVTLLDVSADGI